MVCQDRENSVSLRRGPVTGAANGADSNRAGRLLPKSDGLSMTPMTTHALEGRDRGAWALLAALVALLLSVAGCGSGGGSGVIAGGEIDPQSVTEPRPPAGELAVHRLAALSWSGAPEAQRYRIYLGVGGPSDQPVAETIEPGWQPNEPLDRDRLYRWRVDWVSASDEVVPGPEWSFQTARETLVPDDAVSIQAALDAAPVGERILLRPDTYRETLDFGGKAVTIASLAGPRSTVLEGDGLGPVVTFRTGETTASVLEGLTIRGGGGERGGGVRIEEASPTLRDNIITQNVAERGAGVYAFRSGARLEGNRIRGNTAGEAGGGLALVESSAVLDSNTIASNEVFGRTAILVRGGGVFLRESQDRLVDNEIRGNRLHFAEEHPGTTFSAFGGGVYARGFLDDSPCRLVDNRIVSNTALAAGRAYLTVAGGGVWCQTAVVLANDIRSNEVRADASPSGEPGDENPVALGGGLFAGPGVRLTNNIIAHNRVLLSTSESDTAAGRASGGGLCGEEATSLHDTIAFNRVTIEAGQAEVEGLGVFGHGVELTNTLLWSNGPGSNELSGERLSLRFCLTTLPFEGEGNLAVDPRFVSEDDLHLRASSPCLDAGTQNEVTLPATDIDGDPRLQDNNGDGNPEPDIGADERNK